MQHVLDCAFGINFQTQNLAHQNLDIYNYSSGWNILLALKAGDVKCQTCTSFCCSAAVNVLHVVTVNFLPGGGTNATSIPTSHHHHHHPHLLFLVTFRIEGVGCAFHALRQFVWWRADSVLAVAVEDGTGVSGSGSTGESGCESIVLFSLLVDRETKCVTLEKRSVYKNKKVCTSYTVYPGTFIFSPSPLSLSATSPLSPSPLSHHHAHIRVPKARCTVPLSCITCSCSVSVPGPVLCLYGNPDTNTAVVQLISGEVLRWEGMEKTQPPSLSSWMLGSGHPMKFEQQCGKIELALFNGKVKCARSLSLSY